VTDFFVGNLECYSLLDLSVTQPAATADFRSDSPLLTAGLSRGKRQQAAAVHVSFAYND
jgi:hypothetical protein